MDDRQWAAEWVGWPESWSDKRRKYAKSDADLAEAVRVKCWEPGGLQGTPGAIRWQDCVQAWAQRGALIAAVRKVVE